jgi:hypothetical protein
MFQNCTSATPKGCGADALARVSPKEGLKAALRSASGMKIKARELE